MKLAFLVNPISDRGRGRAHGQGAAARLRSRGAEIDLVETQSFSQTVEKAALLTTSDCDVVVAVGGDGTANAVANGLMNTAEGMRPAMGLIPCGRGNDFAAKLGLKDLDRAHEALHLGRRRRVDVGKTEAGFFLGVAGAGFDSKVARRAQRQVPFLTGSMVYVFALLLTLAELDAIPAKISYDEGFYEGSILFVVAGNTDRYGGGMRITPRASLDDGLLDMCIIKPVSRFTLLRVLPRVFRGGHLDHPAVLYAQTRSVTIESTKPAELFADGEFIQALPAKIETLPSALEVIVPKQGAP
jgi:diacylglycerol kinase (ATP)